MAQPRHNDVTDLIVELTETENVELQKMLQHPLVVKYFKSVAYAAIFEQVQIPVDRLYEGNNNIKLLVDLAYQKGILSLANTILNHTVKE